MRRRRCLCGRALLRAALLAVVVAAIAIASPAAPKRSQRASPRASWFPTTNKLKAVSARRALRPGGAQNGLTVLTSGVPQPFSFPAVSEPTLFDEAGYRIDVPAGAGRLQVNVVVEDYKRADVDLFVRFGTPIDETPAGEPDYFGFTFLGLEQITVSPLNGLQPGTYFIALSLNPSPGEARGVITATISNDTYAGAVLEAGQASSFLLPEVPGPTFFGGGFGFRVDVPAGATALDVSIEPFFPDPEVNVDLFVRYGMEPVEGSGAGGVDADFRSRGPTGIESVHTDAETNPPLEPGPYFIAFVYSTTGVHVDGTVLAAVEMAGPSIHEGGTVLSTGSPLVETIAARSIVSVFGLGFVADGVAADFPELDEAGRITTNLADTCLEIDSRRTAMLTVRPTQINAQAAPQLGLGPVTVVVIRGCGTAQEQCSPAVNATVAEVAPAFFNFTNNQDGTNPIAAVHGGGPALVGEPGLIPGAVFTPAEPGEYVSLFANGFGPTDPSLEAGELPMTVLADQEGQAPLTLAWSLTVGDIPVPPEDVYYVGVAPCCAGLYQLVFRVPPSAPDGNLRVIFTVGGISTPEGPYMTVRRP